MIVGPSVTLPGLHRNLQVGIGITSNTGSESTIRHASCRHGVVDVGTLVVGVPENKVVQWARRQGIAVRGAGRRQERVARVACAIEFAELLFSVLSASLRHGIRIWAG